MPPHRKRRCCRNIPGERIFKPAGMPNRFLETVYIGLDEFEAMRLCDHESKSQIEAAELMGISRGTLQRILEKGRKKLIEALLNNLGINIETTQNNF